MAKTSDTFGISMGSTLVLSLIVGAMVGGASGYLGSLMITRQMALVGDAMGHVALPGMGMAILLKIDPSLGALVFLVLGILAIWRLRECTSLSLETLVGIIFVTSLALGFLVVPEPELLESLIGDISKLTVTSSGLTVLVSLVTLFLVKRIYRGMMLLNISQDLAEVEGIRTRTYNLLYLSAVALVVAIGIRVTGSLLVGALVIIPPATARLLSRSVKQYAGVSIVIGVISSIIGIVLSHAIHFPAGPSIILVSSSLFLGSLVVRRLDLHVQC